MAGAVTAAIDELVSDTSSRLQMGGALESTPETEMEVGVGIDYLHPER